MMASAPIAPNVKTAKKVVGQTITATIAPNFRSEDDKWLFMTISIVIEV